MVGRSWDVFQPLLFGLIGAEITIATLSPSTVGKNHPQNKQTEYHLDLVSVTRNQVDQVLNLPRLC